MMERVLKTLLVAMLLVSLAVVPTFSLADDQLAMPELTETVCAWDEAGHLVSETVVDLNGQPALNARGFASSAYNWDEKGNLLSEAYYDLSGNLVDTVLGYAWVEYTYFTDTAGASHLLTEYRYAADGSLANVTGSYSYRVDTWQDRQILSSEYFDANGDYIRPAGGYARTLYVVQENDGLKTLTKRYLDADGSALVGTEGGAVVVYQYTSKAYLHRELETEQMIMRSAADQEDEAVGTTASLLLSEEIYDADMNPVLGSSRWHKMVNTYDANGNLVRTDYQDAEGNLMLVNQNYASVVHVYDDQNRVIETAYYGLDGQLSKSMTGYAKVTFEYYPETGRKHFETYYGADDTRTSGTYGYSKAEYEYDGEDYDYRITYYDAADAYAMCMYGYARIEYQYVHDDADRSEDTGAVSMTGDIIKQEKYFGTDMNLIKVKAGMAGYVNECNEYGQVIRTTYMDENWQPVRNDEFQYASVTYSYDSNEADAPAVYEAYYDKEGNPCEGRGGYYARSMTYGGPLNKLLLKESYLDAQGQPDVSMINGVSSVVYGYDKNEVQTSARYYDQQGNATTCRSGYATVLREYLSADKILWQVTLGADGQLVTADTSSAAIVYSYDHAGRQTGLKYFKADG